MITIDLKGKIAFVSGGGRGIGLGITEALASAGCTVIITYTSKNPSDTAAALSKKYGVPILPYLCPGEKSEVVNKVVEKCSKEVGEIDFIVANAGVALWKETVDMTDEELQTLMQVNLFAPVYLARAFTRHWMGLSAKTDGTVAEKPAKLELNKKIIFVSSISGLVNMTPQYQVAYNSSKAGLTMAAKTLAGEWAKYGITVNTVSPGYVVTDLIANPPPGEGKTWVSKWRSMTPVDRFANASEIGDMVTLMLSDKCTTFMTGHDMVLDGGYTTY